MKKLIYFLALGAALLLGASCDKESDNVPLYVNTWGDRLKQPFDFRWQIR